MKFMCQNIKKEEKYFIWFGSGEKE